MTGTPPRVLHVITGTGVGGAEMTLLRLARAMKAQGWETQVISLMDVGPVGERLRESGVPVEALNMPRGRPRVGALVTLGRSIRRARPDIVQTWMYHADLLGGVAARLAGVPRVLWNIRHSDLDPRFTRRTTRVTARACALLSRLVPDLIVVNSQCGAATHRAIGYDPRRFRYLPNGIDAAQFRPRAEARAAVRAALGLAPETLLVGRVGRFDPQKGYAEFVRAAGLLRRRLPDAPLAFVLCGDGCTPENGELRAWIAEAGIGDACHLLGRRDDMAEVVAALDLACSSSVYGEGFPNVIAEAMACGVPCVATDVGDSRVLLDDDGLVVPPGDPAAMATALERLVAAGPTLRRVLGTRLRQRILDHFTIERIAADYCAMYRSLAGGASAAPLPARPAP